MVNLHVLQPTFASYSPGGWFLNVDLTHGGGGGDFNREFKCQTANYQQTNNKQPLTHSLTSLLSATTVVSSLRS
jgi:hypothetical protein